MPYVAILEYQNISSQLRGVLQQKIL